MKRLWWPILLIVVFGSSVLGNSRYLFKQSTTTDCGPAAIATLIHYYLRITTSESEMIYLTKYRPDSGTTLQGLEEAAMSKGCAAGSFRMEYVKLQEQLATFRTPVIVRTSNPEPHYAIVLAIDKDYVYLADPGVGNTVLRRNAFLKRWYLPRTDEGYVVVITAPDEYVNMTGISTVVEELRYELRGLERSRPWPTAVR